MKKLLLLSVVVLMCSQSMVAKNKDKAWIVNAVVNDWTVKAASSVMPEETISKPRQVNVGNKDYTITITTPEVQRGAEVYFNQGKVTTNINQKGVYEISNPVRTGQAAWTGTKDVQLYNVTFKRLADSEAASKYPALKY